jgi:hypothetical protein
MVCLINLVRTFFRCKRRFEKLFQDEKDVLPTRQPNAPWLWIGAVTHSGEKITYTDEINSSIKYGQKVDHCFLRKIIETDRIKHWMYLCPQTLEEKYFPSEGFVIEDDSRQSEYNQKLE